MGTFTSITTISSLVLPVYGYTKNDMNE